MLSVLNTKRIQVLLGFPRFCSILDMFAGIPQTSASASATANRPHIFKCLHPPSKSIDAVFADTDVLQDENEEKVSDENDPAALSIKISKGK